MLKNYYGVGLRVLRYCEPYLLPLVVKGKWSKRVSSQTRTEGGIRLPFGCSFPSPLYPSSQT
jgi:hypothetical protein